MRKIIYISFGRLTDKISRDWFVEFLIKKEVEVEYWDIVSLMRESYEEKGSITPSYMRTISSYNEFESLLKLNQNAIYVMLVTHTARFSKPYKLLSKYQCKMVFLNWGAMPTSDYDHRIKKVVKLFFSNPKIFLTRLMEHFLSLVYRRFKLIKKFEIVFTAGENLKSADQFSKKVVPFNLCDYDHYKAVQNSKLKIITGKYAVFLDINLPYQSDLSLCGLPCVDDERYFQSLNVFFDFLEKKYNLKVVIAAHPKSNYDAEKFGGRECHRMVTAELVKDAEFVVTHTSTALSYAVLNFKPILFVYNDNMMDIYRNTLLTEMKCLSSYLKSKLINIDRLKNDKDVDLLKVSLESYQAYKYSYLTCYESENFFSADIFWNEIKSM